MSRVLEGCIECSFSQRFISGIDESGPIFAVNKDPNLIKIIGLIKIMIKLIKNTKG